MRNPLSALFLPLILLAATPAAADEVLTGIREYITAQKASGRIDLNNPAWRTAVPPPPEVTFEEGKTYTWTLSTNKGTMTFRFLPEAAPRHVASFLYLSELGFYDGLGFHRVIKGFMAQGGCPYGRGNGGPGYNLPLEAKPDVKHDTRGTLSMARSRAPDSAGSQFFITFGPTPMLDKGYTVFGRMTGGEETLAAFEAVGKPRDPAPPSEPLTILSAKVAVE